MGPGPYLSTSPANVASSRLGQLTTKTPTHAHVPNPCGCPGPLLNSQHRPPAPLPASWPSSRCGQRQGPAASRVPAPLRHCCSSLAPGKSHRAIHCSCPAPPPGLEGPHSPSGAGGHMLTARPSVLAGTRWGMRGWAVRSFGARPSARGQGVPRDSGQAGCGLDWAKASDPGRGAARGDIWGRNPTAVSLWCQHNCRPQRVGRSATHTDTRSSHSREPRHGPQQAPPGRVAGPAPGLRGFW